MDPDRLLGIYMNDHLAGSAFGISLAHRIAEQHEQGGEEDETAAVAREIEEDRDTLVALMRRLDVRPKRSRQIVAHPRERLGRVKLSGALVRRSPLSRLEELETMRIGVTGKLQLWRALKLVAPSHSRLDEQELDRLIQRAESQIERLERLRLDAARESFVVGETKHHEEGNRAAAPR